MENNSSMFPGLQTPLVSSVWECEVESVYILLLIQTDP